MRSERPNFLLLDVMLPDTNGFDLLKTIRAQPALSNIPAAAITTDGSSQARARSRIWIL